MRADLMQPEQTQDKCPTRPTRGVDWRLIHLAVTSIEAGQAEYVEGKGWSAQRDHLGDVLVRIWGTRPRALPDVRPREDPI